MKSSPHRPLILKRRKRFLPQGDSSSTLVRDEPNGGSPKRKQARTNRHDTKIQDSEIQDVLPGIKIINDSTMPNAQVVTIPPNTDIQNILEALTSKGKESHNNEPNKFIHISSDISSIAMQTRTFKNETRSTDEHYAANNGALKEEKHIGQNFGTTGASTFCTSESLPMGEEELEGNGSEETAGSDLDNSLTNIQWLGKMSSSGLSPCNVKKETEKENQTPKQKTAKVEEESAAPSSSSSWQESFLERPPYSYMAMIQFAINSTEKKCMMLKDIYTWIEDHFPYFKHVAKPGWKNSIRHNLSLHDMFVRETSANGKISFWTIHPEANRYLTLDQVFKPLDAGPPVSPELLESQQKRHTMDLQKNVGGSSGNKSEPQTARRKMKPLLPRVSSYLIPIQFPVSQSLLLQPSSKVSPPTAQGASEKKSSKQVLIAPKVFPSSGDPTSSIKVEAYCGEDSSLLTSHLSSKEDGPQISRESFPSARSVEKNESSSSRKWASLFCPALSVKEEPVSPVEELNVCLPGPSVKQKRQFTALKSPPQSTLLDTSAINRQERHHVGKSRRKQHLAMSCSEEPLLLLPSSGSSDSSTLERDLPFGQETPPLRNMADLTCSPGEGGSFKTPAKEMLCRLPDSSSPSKTPIPTLPFLALSDTWRSASSVKETNDLDISPARTPPGPLLSLQENAELLGIRSTPPRHSLCDSPHLPFLNAGGNAMVSGPLTSSPAPSKQSSPKLQDSVLPENHSFLEGLVLDTMNDNLGKILLDVSFPGLDDDNLGTDLSWSYLIPELK
ncbi:forkhead box protein M1 isoform X2 [Pogona vitticeps]